VRHQLADVPRTVPHLAPRSARLGLWADAAPVPPWEWRAAKGQLDRAKKWS
jgi:hypothetical protein